MVKAAQGFSASRTRSTLQPETRGERRPSRKRPFKGEHLKLFQNLQMSDF